MGQKYSLKKNKEHPSRPFHFCSLVWVRGGREGGGKGGGVLRVEENWEGGKERVRGVWCVREGVCGCVVVLWEGGEGM